MASKTPDAKALAEDVRKLIKRVDELEIEKKNLVKKVSDHDTALTVLRNRGNDLSYKAEAAEKRAIDLESKLKAVDHNALARLANSRLANANTPLTPLKDMNTNLPIAKFPKHEKDVRFMSSLEVTQALTSLNAPTTGNTGEQKTRVKEYIGLPPASAQKPAASSSSSPAAAEADTAPGAASTTAKKPNATPGATKKPGATNPPGATNTPAQRPPLKKTMTMEDRKAAGIKAARAKAENDRKMGGRAPVARAKKPMELDVKGVKGDVDGVASEKGEVDGMGKAK